MNFTTNLSADTFLQIAILFICVPAGVAAARIQRTIANPTTILCIAFFIPLYFATFRLSGMQATTWSYDTYITLFTTIGAWSLLPFIATSIIRKNTPTPSTHDELDKNRLLNTSRFFSIITILAYIAGNLVQAKTLIPALHPELAFDVHAEFPSGIRFFARATPAAAIISYIAYFKYRKKWDIFFIVTATLIPLTRLSRIDPALTLIGLACISTIYPLFRLSRSKQLFIAILATLALIGAAELGTQRQNRFGTYEFKYSEMIKWKTDIVGPSEIIPTLYGYTSLSFENLDASISKYKGNHTIALYSFDWLFTGFLKLNWITPYEATRAEFSQREVIATAATVPTALLPFFNDFGSIGIAIPLTIYIAIWTWFFSKRHKSPLFAALFSIYSGAFALSSFQAQIASSPIAQQLVWAALIFVYSSKKIAK